MQALSIVEDEEFQKPNSGGQREFMEDYDSPYCAFKGGWYSGKTWAGARKFSNIHIHNALDEDNQPTYCKGVIVAQTYSLARTINIPELQSAFDEMGLSYRFVPDLKRYCFEMFDFGTKRRPSEILVRSADSPETINGFTAGHGWGDEAARWPISEDDPKRDPFLQLKGRVRDPKAKIRQINYTYTPEGDDTRMYVDFEQEPKDGHTIYTSGTQENPFAVEFAQTMLGQLTPELAKQYLDGLTIQLRGNKMYTSFNRELHVDSKGVKTSLKPNLPLQFSVDFNISPGMHGVMGQYDFAKDIFTARYVLHHQQMTVPMLVKNLAAMLKTLGWRPGTGWPWAGGRLELYGDATGGNNSASRGESAWQVLTESMKEEQIPYLLKVDNSNPHVADRVNAVNVAFNDARGNIHYYVHSDCAALIADYSRMKWNEHGDQDKRDKKRSHASEADGYRIHFQRPLKRPAPVERALRNMPVVVR